jgi:hypothetical protein
MKRTVWILAILMLASPAWAAKKITVQQLKDLLVSIQQDKKTDEDAAAEIRQVELTEELTRPAFYKIVALAPGKFSIEQMYVLQALSAMLPPPASDLPATPAPDAAAQKALLDKSAEFTAKYYAQMPPLAATKTTLRFQDNMETVAACSGVTGCAKDATTSNGLTTSASFIHFINSAETQVATEHGREIAPAKKDKAPWGANGMIALQEPDPNLSVILPEALSAQSIQWLRWQLVNGKQAAVYSFKGPAKDSSLAVDFCCFPTRTQTGTASFYTNVTAKSIAGSAAAGGGAAGVAGDFQTSTSYDHHFKAKVPYHGEIFIEPATGIVLRLVLQAEFKASDEVQQEDWRIDYSPVIVGSKAMVLPDKIFLNTTVIPNGNSGAGKFSTRRTLFISDCKDYKPAAR